MLPDLNFLSAGATGRSTHVTVEEAEAWSSLLAPQARV